MLLNFISIATLLHTHTFPRDLGAIVEIFKVSIAAFVVQSVGTGVSIRFDLEYLYCVLPEKLFLNKTGTNCKEIDICV